VTRIAVAFEAALVAAAVVVGAVLNLRHVPIHADAAPLFAVWHPHAGPGTPAALAVAVAVVRYGPGLAQRLPWHRLAWFGYGVCLLWTVSLALVDGWSRGIAERLTPQAEYLHDVPKVHGIGAPLAGFDSHILDFRPGSWATHVAGHPPGAFLVFVGLDRIGLPGGVPAALLCILVGATAPVSVAYAVRALGYQDAARAALPFLVLFPGVVWVGASADGFFAGVVAAGLALLAAGRGLLGGLVLGGALYLSYGLVLAGLLALAVLWLRRRAGTAATAGLGVAGVVAAFTAAGFWWPTGYHLVVRRYFQGWAAERPYGYWVWADLAALLLCTGPAIGPALLRLPRRAGIALVPLAALAAIVAADLSGLSKAEVERIWLPYAIWLLVATAWLPARQHRAWLAAQALTALAVNHLLLTPW
jgi:methylthioxylose transferase